MKINPQNFWAGATAGVGVVGCTLLALSVALGILHGFGAGHYAGIVLGGSVFVVGVPIGLIKLVQHKRNEIAQECKQDKNRPDIASDSEL